MKKYTLVTGSSDGIGKELAFKLINNGYSVIFHGSNIDKLKNIETEVPENSDCKFWLCDLSNKANDELDYSIFKNIVVDSIIINAGIIPIGKLKSVNKENLQKTLFINAISQIRLCEYLLRHSGLNNIFSISSLSTIYGFKGYSLYAGSKSILNFLDEYFFDSKVKVFSFILGDIIKDINGSILANPELTSNLNKIYPFGLGTSLDVANIFFQIFKYRSYLNGSKYLLDGGISNKSPINS